ncbi:hypothetical protein BRDCF_p1419 [Bacteroidales bacterium CF]|jgi:hypothetical protein|nr:hypothetical protein BRDCF_p1419 [Bacteroidales bacterium CF]
MISSHKKITLYTKNRLSTIVVSNKNKKVDFDFDDEEACYTSAIQ